MVGLKGRAYTILYFYFLRTCYPLSYYPVHLTTDGRNLEYCSHKKAVALHTMEALGGEEVEILLIRDLGTRWG
jgi:hypothetical protein